MSDAPVTVTLNPPGTPMPTAAAPPPGLTMRAPPGMTEVVDSLGRRLVIKPLDAVAQFDLLEACGANAGNDRYLGMAALVASVFMINDDVLPFPTNRDMLRRRVRELGDAGIDAAAQALSPAKAEGPGQVAATAKN